MKFDKQAGSMLVSAPNMPAENQPGKGTKDSKEKKQPKKEARRCVVDTDKIAKEIVDLFSPEVLLKYPLTHGVDLQKVQQEEKSIPDPQT